MTRLSARALAFGYPGRPVGRDVTLDVAPGEVTVLLGPNGSGKTTLFKTLLGLLAPQGGEVLLGGTRLERIPARLLARTVAYVPQAYTGYFPYTVLDTVLMGRTARLPLFATPSRADRAVALRSLDLLGVGHLADAPLTAVSGGERQLVLVARALAQEPALLVMDEPTASLDFGNQVRVLERIARLADEGIGILLSTHDPDQAFLYGDRVAILHGGRLVALGPPEAVITPETLRIAYGVEVEVVRLDGRRRVCVPRLPARAGRPGR